MRLFIITLSFLLLFTTSNSIADAPLDKKLGLDVELAKKVKEIQKKYRLEFSSKRQQLHREQRKLRRAKNDSDSETIANQAALTAELQAELKQIRMSENEEIRQKLNQEQRTKFEEALKQRKAAYGSSRDEKEF